MAGLPTQIPVVVTGAGTRSPAVEALLQGPEEYAAAMEGDISPEEFAIRAEALRIFDTGINTAGLQAYKNDPTAALSESTRSGGIRLGTYAVGRAAVVDAMDSRKVDGKRVWVFDPNFHPKPKPSPEIRTPHLDRNFDHQRIEIGSPNEMTLRGRIAGLNSDSLDESLSYFQVRQNESTSEQLNKLRTIWSNPSVHASERTKALVTWYRVAIGGKQPRPESLGVQFATTPVVLDVIEGLLSVIRNIDPNRAKKEEQILRYDATLVLGELISTNYDRANLLPEIFDKIPSDTTGGVYGDVLIRAAGAVFAASHVYGHTESQNKALSGGALRFLDMAGDTTYPLELRINAFRYGLYTLPLFGPPSGLQILRDFALWQVQSRDPETAASTAHAYGSLYTAEGSCFAGIIPPNAVQRAMLLEALKRRDLTPGQRDDLWGQITRNSDLLVATEVALRRRFGESADPRP